MSTVRAAFPNSTSAKLSQCAKGGAPILATGKTLLSLQDPVSSDAQHSTEHAMHTVLQWPNLMTLRLPLADDDARRLRSSRQCPFCSAVFSRVDGAKRHAKDCPQRGNRALHTGKRGRKTKSCDQCSRVKVHCNAAHPCERCKARKLDCTFSRYCTDATHRQPTAHQESPDSPSRSTHNRVPLSFLLNYTDERQDFITEKAVGEEPDGALIGPTCAAPTESYGQAPCDSAIGYIDPMMLLPFDDGLTDIGSLELGGLYDTEEQDLLGALLSQAPPSQADRLAARLDLLELEELHSTPVPFGDSSVSPTCKALPRYSVANGIIVTQSFIGLHLLSRRHLSLLMVVALTGATYSYRPGHGPEHIIEARNLYHLADSYVFHQLRTGLDRLQPTSDVGLAEAVQLCQAALLMYGLDTLLASDSAMQRVAMTERLPETMPKFLDSDSRRNDECDSLPLSHLHIIMCVKIPAHTDIQSPFEKFGVYFLGVSVKLWALNPSFHGSMESFVRKFLEAGQMFLPEVNIRSTRMIRKVTRFGVWPIWNPGGAVSVVQSVDRAKFEEMQQDLYFCVVVLRTKGKFSNVSVYLLPMAAVVQLEPVVLAEAEQSSDSVLLLATFGLMKVPKVF
ncbi:hypothetical protein PG988_015896 [Apiospora saccharicola]